MTWIAAVVVLGLLLLIWGVRGLSPGTGAKSAGVARAEKSELNLGDLIQRLALTPEDVKSIAAPVYREVHVPKSSGGTRRLEIPDDNTMAMQRRILHQLLAKLKSHPAATGFETGRSIVDAAAPHTNKRIVVRIDIEKFFESTSAERVGEYFRYIGWDDSAVQFLLTMTTHDGHLPQGAPTSPKLSNLANARVDAALNKVAERFHGHYSRYADDITLSFNFRSGRKARGIVQIVRRVLSQAGYRMNGRKTRIMRRHQRQQVMGLTVNEHVAVPRRRRRQLRAARHRIRKGLPASFSADELQGWTAFEKMVEDQR